jgi:hypothetical protein
MTWLARILRGIADWLAPQEYEVHFDWVPAGRLIKGPAHCTNCGHRGTVWVPYDKRVPDLENEILDSLCCPVCGLYTCCSD